MSKQIEIDIKTLWTATAGTRLDAEGPEFLFTLANGTTYFADLGAVQAGADWSMFWSWKAALVAAITFESTSLRAIPDGATPFVPAGRLWYPETGVTTVSPAASEACATQHFTNFQAGRGRFKIAVTTGGTLQLRGRAVIKPRA